MNATETIILAKRNSQRVTMAGGLVAVLALVLTSCGGTATPTASNSAIGSTQTTASSGTISAQTLSPEEKLILDAVNVARSQAHSCGGTAYSATTPLTWNGLLANAAKAHSQDLADVNFTADPSNPDQMHIGSDGSTPQQRIERAGYTGWTSSGENFAAGYDVSQVVDAWLASPGHCKNIMNPKYKEIGIGYVYSASARYHTYYTQDFGAR